MNPIPVNLAFEDQVSGAVLRRLLEYVDRGYEVGGASSRGGFGYLRKRIHGWNQAAAGTPFLVLTNLDAGYSCPRELIDDWLPVAQHPNLLLRVAVKEVEAWLLAGHCNLAQFLGVSADNVPRDAESLADPKATLIELARRSRRREIRERVAPRPGSTARQGPDYNGCVIEFVVCLWDIRTATAPRSA